MVLIRNNCHNLFCHFYSINYDQVGFVHDGKLWLFWIIPTATSPYIGREDEFELRGAKEYFSELNIKKCSSSTFITCLQNIKSYHSEHLTSFSEQYSERRPAGLKFVNKVLSSLGFSDLSPHGFSESCILGKFLPLGLVKHNNDTTSVHCQDLLEMITNFPETLISKQEARLRKLASRASGALYHILNCSVLEEDKVIEYYKLVVDINSCLPSIENESTVEALKEESNDQLIIVYRDGSAERTIREIRVLVRKMLAGEEKINLARLLQLMNQLFSLFHIKEIKADWPQLPFSHFVAFVENYEEVNNDDSAGRVISEKKVCLSGDGLESLTTEELEELLRDLNDREDDDKFDHLRNLATQLYYQRKPS